MMYRVWLSTLVLAALLLSGCTSLRELPRSEYAARPERKHVRLLTTEGLVYEFDFIRLAGDTLVGYRQQSAAEGPFEEFGSLRVPLREIQTLSTRSVDWYRTGLIGGGLLAAVVVAGLSTSGDDSSGDQSGGTGGRDGP